MTTSTQADTLLHNVYARNHTLLNGRWQVIVDPFDAGYYDYRLNESADGFFKNAKPRHKAGCRTYLNFAAANYEADVYLNGQKLGKHIGGYMPFHYDITDRVAEGDNFGVLQDFYRQKAQEYGK